jgi:hypothetical protein
MIRVTRSGGRIVVFDFDWDTLLVDHPDRALSDKICELMDDKIQWNHTLRTLQPLEGGEVLPSFTRDLLPPPGSS